MGNKTIVRAFNEEMPKYFKILMYQIKIVYADPVRILFRNLFSV
jgi:hypothetical protein